MNPHAFCKLVIPLLLLLVQPMPSCADDAPPNAQPTPATNPAATGQQTDRGSPELVKNRASKPLWISGITLALLPYAGFITSGLFCAVGACLGAIFGGGDWSVYKEVMPSGYSFIPLAGPFIDVGISLSSGQRSPTRVVFYSMAGIAEVAGVTMAIVGAALPKKRLALSSGRITALSFGYSGNGVTLTGAF